jgi:hypothetical protein
MRKYLRGGATKKGLTLSAKRLPDLLAGLREADGELAALENFGRR